MKNFVKTSKVRTKKLTTRVDFAAMVSVSFLLIVFFMLTSAMSRPQSLDFSMPEKYTDCGGIITCGFPDYNRVLILLLGSNDKLICYSGMLQYPIIAPKQVTFGQKGIRKELLYQKKRIQDYCNSIGKSKTGMTVIIKPSAASNYKNLIDILDEMAIVGVDTYAVINDFTAEEKKLLDTK